MAYFAFADKQERGSERKALNLSTNEPIIRVKIADRSRCLPPAWDPRRSVCLLRAPHRHNAATLSVSGNRIDCVLRRSEREPHVLIHTNAQPLFRRTLTNTTDAYAWAEQERIAWVNL